MTWDKQGTFEDKHPAQKAEGREQTCHMTFCKRHPFLPHKVQEQELNSGLLSASEAWQFSQNKVLKWGVGQRIARSVTPRQWGHQARVSSPFYPYNKEIWVCALLHMRPSGALLTCGLEKHIILSFAPAILSVKWRNIMVDIVCPEKQTFNIQVEHFFFFPLLSQNLVLFFRLGDKCHLLSLALTLLEKLPMYLCHIRNAVISWLSSSPD